MNVPDANRYCVMPAFTRDSKRFKRPDATHDTIHAVVGAPDKHNIQTSNKYATQTISNRLQSTSLLFTYCFKNNAKENLEHLNYIHKLTGKTCVTDNDNLIQEVPKEELVRRQYLPAYCLGHQIIHHWH